jgi:hypothetical protein
MVLTISDIEEFEADLPELRNGDYEVDSEGEKFTIDLYGDGRNWHFFIGPSVVEVTVPEENHLHMRETRKAVEMTCRAITMMMEMHQFRKAQREEPEHE